MTDDDTVTIKEPFEGVVGEQLSAVIFVQDYLQLQFSNGCILTAITWPVVRLGCIVFRPGMPNYRDALCDRITKTVSDGVVTEGDEVRIEFEDDSIVSISLRDEDRITAEAAILDCKPDQWWSW